MNLSAVLLVSCVGGHHILPHQDLWTQYLPPSRREPLGGWTLPATGRRQPETTRSAPTERPARRLAHVGCPLGSLGPPALRACPVQAPDQLDPAHRPGAWRGHRGLAGSGPVNGFRGVIINRPARRMNSISLIPWKQLLSSRIHLTIHAIYRTVVNVQHQRASCLRHVLQSRREDGSMKPNATGHPRFLGDRVWVTPFAPSASFHRGPIEALEPWPH
jgi:hypothetical protein